MYKIYIYIYIYIYLYLYTLNIVQYTRIIYSQKWEMYLYADTLSLSPLSSACCAVFAIVCGAIVPNILLNVHPCTFLHTHTHTNAYTMHTHTQYTQTHTCIALELYTYTHTPRTQKHTQHNTHMHTHTKLKDLFFGGAWITSWWPVNLHEKVSSFRKKKIFHVNFSPFHVFVVCVCWWLSV
jgi:hypothetical protein